MQVDLTNWSGDGSLTGLLIEVLKGLDEIAVLRVEDAPASRAEAGYNFIANEIFVAFATRERRETRRLAGILPLPRRVSEPAMTLTTLEVRLSASERVGPPDYTDNGMLQYLRAERIVPPYQTRGYKLVELVRIYELGSGRASGPEPSS
jgi:hypothetical protein